MKLVILSFILTVLTGLALATGHQTARTHVPVAPHAFCHQEYLCGPGGCGWVWICN